MSSIITIAELADELGVNKSTISRHAARLGVGTRLGNLVVLTKAEAAAVRRSQKEARPGNPNAARDGAKYGGPKNTKKKRG